jgi:hypothetical protein
MRSRYYWLKAETDEVLFGCRGTMTYTVCRIKDREAFSLWAELGGILLRKAVKAFIRWYVGVVEKATGCGDNYAANS